jgi:Tfp pilus assembly major pilin PilA
MSLQLKSKQRGISFFGLIFVAGVLAVCGVIAAQVFPTVVEYQSVVKAVNKAAEGSSVAEVKMIFDKQTSIDDIRSIQGSELEVTKEGDKVVVKFAYQREIHLTGPAFLTLKYSGRSK